MKITKTQLRKIIKEEIQTVLQEDDSVNIEMIQAWGEENGMGHDLKKAVTTYLEMYNDDPSNPIVSQDQAAELIAAAEQGNSTAAADEDEYDPSKYF
jgi:uncharacterized protein (UPF0335 family)